MFAQFLRPLHVLPGFRVACFRMTRFFSRLALPTTGPHRRGRRSVLSNLAALHVSFKVGTLFACALSCFVFLPGFRNKVVRHVPFLTVLRDACRPSAEPADEAFAPAALPPSLKVGASSCTSSLSFAFTMRFSKGNLMPFNCLSKIAFPCPLQTTVSPRPPLLCAAVAPSPPPAFHA